MTFSAADASVVSGPLDDDDGDDDFGEGTAERDGVDGGHSLRGSGLPCPPPPPHAASSRIVSVSHR